MTGGSAGIGKAIALRLAQAGAKTLIVARDEEKLDLTREEFAAQGLEVETYSADISDPAQCAAFIQRILSEHGGIDILDQQRRALDPPLGREFLRPACTTSNG